ncbi:MarR family transcriptional regulator [Desulfosporosinus sp. PR]|uniref:MarR family winged helix-turn-helix transcriptional regulator n=1 Tax=Candidatus Desulfosporosinus nitrosoreducens TaxID=3401928 RepID=UPI0027E9986A|nr:MarR family transcriptional regulator [Desulfosporosinus sp. PR]MDQ7094074.1 MarR family transcriptional regulator [Desulfosporosinus sp. PR]
MNGFNLDDSLGYIVAKTNFHMKSYFNKLIKKNNLDVTTEQWVILNAVRQNPGASQTDLARISFKDKTNVTRILDLLVKKGYVTRNIAGKDRRIYSITLTDSGEDVLEQLIRVAEQANKTFIRDLDHDNYLKFASTLKEILNSAEKLSSNLD